LRTSSRNYYYDYYCVYSSIAKINYHNDLNFFFPFVSLNGVIKSTFENFSSHFIFHSFLWRNLSSTELRYKGTNKD
jgi:hypothetical protein